MKTFIEKLSAYKPIIIDIIALIVAIIALVISVNALRLSERQLEISDPASSLFVNNIYLDVTDRLSNLLWGRELYDYTIVAEIFNTGNQPIIITGFSIGMNNANLHSTLTTSIHHNSPRIYYSLDNAEARNAIPINPIVLEPTKKVLIRSENALKLKAVSDYVASFDRDEIIIYLPHKNSGEQAPVSGWKNGEDFSVESLESFIDSRLCNSKIDLNFKFLNSKKLLTKSIYLNEGSDGFDIEKNNRINFDQLLIDEVLMTDIAYIIGKDSLIPKPGVRSNQKKMQIALEDILQPMGFDNRLYYYGVAGGYMIEKWNPRNPLE